MTNAMERRTMTNTLKRREFLKRCGSMAAVPLCSVSSATPFPADRERVLVLVHLAGGNDSLNTVVPYRNRGYYQLRPTIALPESGVIPIDDRVAFNGQLAPLAALYHEGALAIVCGIGHATPGCSHPSSPAIELPGGGVPQRQDDLAQVAARIHTGTAAKICCVTFDGFDTHTNQRARQDALLAALGARLDRFQRQLRRDGTSHRVLTVVFSEFGRRIEENACGGTDHGSAQHVLLIGDRIKGGAYGDVDQLAGAARPVPPAHPLPGCLPVQSGFPAFYSAILRGWLGTAPAPGNADGVAPTPFLA